MQQGVVLAVKVVPRASKHEVVGWEGDVLKIRLKANAEKGEANEALIRFLAEKLHLPKSQIHLTHGHTSRHKRLFIEGATLIILKELLKR